LGGKVNGKWPGLEKDQLEEPGDLRVTTDYRSVLSEVLSRRMGFSDSGTVFPGFEPARAGTSVIGRGSAQRPPLL
jgi:uncharacterized protein (DUF1501 family)